MPIEIRFVQSIQSMIRILVHLQSETMRRSKLSPAILLIFALSMTGVAAVGCTAPARDSTPEIHSLPASGRLVVQGQDGNLYILEGDATPIGLTDDAHWPTDKAPTSLQYSDPTWSTTGWLSYVRTSVNDQDQPSLSVIALPPDRLSPVTVLEAESDSYVYGYWAPAACESGTNCGRLAYLINDNEGIAMHLAEVSADGPVVDDTILGRSAPFFYSWAPDGHAMLWYLQHERLVVFGVDEGTSTGLPDLPGSFAAPAWSPVDDRLMFARYDGVSSRELRKSFITIFAGGEHTDIGTQSDTAIYFEWSPDGETVAWTTGGDPLDPVVLSQADGSGQNIQIDIENVVAFFWSPDSQQLAIVALEPIGEDETADLGSPLSMIFTWWTVDVQTGRTTQRARFFPTQEQFDLFRNFDQYAQSHRVWSPDSRYIVYADLPERGSRTLPGTVRLIDTARPDQEPLVLMEGRQAVFSFDG